MDPVYETFKSQVKDYVAIDDSLKRNSKEAAISRKEKKELSDLIARFLDERREFDKVKIPGGYLAARQKTLKVPFTEAQKRAELQRLLSAGITDAEKIWETLKAGSGTKVELRLTRRSTRKRKAKDAGKGDSRPAKKQHVAGPPAM